MAEPLTEIIKREGIKTQLIKEDVCIGTVAASKFMGVSRMTAYRLYKRGIYERCYIDPMNGHLYIPIEVVEKLRPDNRMVKI